MAMAKVFKNSVMNCKVITPTGRIITFFNGKHITSIEKDIKYLEEMAAESGSYVYIDPKEHEIDTEELTEEGRIAKLKREAVEEFIAQQARAADINSSSETQQLRPGSSATVSPVAAESVSAPVGNTAGLKVTAPAAASTK